MKGIKSKSGTVGKQKNKCPDCICDVMAFQVVKPADTFSAVKNSHFIVSHLLNDDKIKQVNKTIIISFKLISHKVKVLKHN